ncbi:hypothetical protein JCM8097_008000 [Rhodosporidiobolus ruineniae]
MSASTTGLRNRCYLHPTHKQVCGVKSRPFLPPPLREDELVILKQNMGAVQALAEITDVPLSGGSLASRRRPQVPPRAPSRIEGTAQRHARFMIEIVIALKSEKLGGNHIPEQDWFVELNHRFLAMMTLAEVASANGVDVAKALDLRREALHHSVMMLMDLRQLKGLE